PSAPTVAAASTRLRSIELNPSERAPKGRATKKIARLITAVQRSPKAPAGAPKARKPRAVMTGGGMRGAMPSHWKTFVQAAMRRHENHASGRAIRTARAAAPAARRSEFINAAFQPGSRKICAYQESENPCGGKISDWRSLTDTPSTTTRGAARK